MTRASSRLISAVLAAVAACAAMAARAEEPFSYQGKTVSVLVASTPGGGYDFYARLLARHLAKHLPGNPTVVVKNMPGAGGVVLANYLQARAARDGTEFGAFEHGTAFTALLTGTRAEFDPTKLGWLGSMEQFTPIVAVWHTTPIHTADDLLVKPMNVGTSGAGSTTSGYPNALNGILGTKMKVIGGYPGSAEINLAIERGELDGVASWCWTCAKTQKPQWIAENKLRVVLQLAPTPDPELRQKGIPTVFEWAKTDEQRRMLTIVFGSVAMSRPFAAPPGLPPARLAMLRAGFEHAVKDLELVADAQGKGFVVTFVAPAVLERLIASAYATDPELIAKVRAAYSGK